MRGGAPGRAGLGKRSEGLSAHRGVGSAAGDLRVQPDRDAVRAWSVPISDRPSSTTAGCGSSSVIRGRTPSSVTASRGRPIGRRSRGSGWSSCRRAPASSVRGWRRRTGVRCPRGRSRCHSTGSALGGHMYVFRTTEHYREAGREVMGRSILTRAVNGDPTNLVCLYDLSIARHGGKFINVSCVAVEDGRGGAAVRRAGVAGVGQRAVPGERRLLRLRPARGRGGPRALAVLVGSRGPLRSGRCGRRTSVTPSRCSRTRRSVSSRRPGTPRWGCGCCCTTPARRAGSPPVSRSTRGGPGPKRWSCSTPADRARDTASSCTCGMRRTACPTRVVRASGVVSTGRT